MDTMNSNSSNENRSEVRDNQPCEDVVSPDRHDSLSIFSPVIDEESCMTSNANKTHPFWINSQFEMQNSGTELKRKERNAREKERSCHIAHQIHELKCLLRSGGINTSASESKSSILEKAAKYIKFLQNSQYEAQIDRQQMFKQLLDTRATTGNRLSGTQNAQLSPSGYLSYLSFQTDDGIPPKDILRGPAIVLDMTRSDDLKFRLIIQACSAGIVISSLGGELIECNETFCDIAKSTLQQICSMTIFDLIKKEELDSAYDKLNKMLSQGMPFENSYAFKQQSIILRGGAKVNNADMELVLVKGDDGRNICLCLTVHQCYGSA